MCMKKNNNRLLRGVAAVLCLALMFLTMSGMAMATDMEDAPAGGAPESTPEIVEAELPVTPEGTPESPPAEQGPDTQEPPPRRLKRRKRRSRRRNMCWTQIFRQAGTTRR